MRFFGRDFSFKFLGGGIVFGQCGGVGAFAFGCGVVAGFAVLFGEMSFFFLFVGVEAFVVGVLVEAGWAVGGGVHGDSVVVCGVITELLLHDKCDGSDHDHCSTSCDM